MANFHYYATFNRFFICGNPHCTICTSLCVMCKIGVTTSDNVLYLAFVFLAFIPILRIMPRHYYLVILNLSWKLCNYFMQCCKSFEYWFCFRLTWQTELFLNCYVTYLYITLRFKVPLVHLLVKLPCFLFHKVTFQMYWNWYCHCHVQNSEMIEAILSKQ